MNLDEIRKKYSLGSVSVWPFTKSDGENREPSEDRTPYTSDL